MRCHKCNQDSLKIDNGHIICDICGLDIHISVNLEEDHFFDLFFYNKNLEEAEKLGQEAMIEGKDYGDNPYCPHGDKLLLHKKWQEGYNREKQTYEFSALSLSSEKIENQLKTEIRILKDEKEKFIPNNCRLIEYFCKDLTDRKIIGKMLRKQVLDFLKKYKAFHRDALGTWKHPD